MGSLSRVPEGSRGPADAAGYPAIVIVAAAVCPAAPVLMPAVAPRADPTLAGLRAACERAIRALLAPAPDRIVVLASAAAGCPAAGPLPLPDPSLAAGPYVRSDLTQRTGSGEPATSATSPGAAVASVLLRQAASTVPARAVELDPARLDLAALPDVGAEGERVGLVVMGEGSVGHGPAAPAGPDTGADAFDDALAAALAAGDPRKLAAALDGQTGQHVSAQAAATAALRALAALTAERPRPSAELVYRAAPFGVGYLVATWRWASAPASR